MPAPPVLDDDALVADLTARIVEFARPLKIILFESRARGTARPDSDVDLLVVMPDGTDRREAMVQIGSRLPLYDVDAELLVTTPAALRDQSRRPGLVYPEILRTGRTLYAA